MISMTGTWFLALQRFLSHTFCLKFMSRCLLVNERDHIYGKGFVHAHVYTVCVFCSFGIYIYIYIYLYDGKWGFAKTLSTLSG